VVKSNRNKTTKLECTLRVQTFANAATYDLVSPYILKLAVIPYFSKIAGFPNPIAVNFTVNMMDAVACSV